MGFSELWCSWILSCLSSAVISVLVNGTPTRVFGISRGLRQGCPLSPMLFNIVAEALSSLLTKAVSNGFFSGFNLGADGLGISHLQFADDLVIFCGRSETQIRNVIRLLRGFEVAAGLRVNRGKSKLIGINIEDNVVSSWASLFHCKNEKFPCFYLGLSLGH
ncbi:hypothetical protein HRI_001970900 [Hibiscus trionum]|uniref:Reverse transcriptase domain-containing protein n=1 Tax=Hibiscus trionum TaxID=183268 RepID=A0A9W7M0F5_HIBTR|nr:hypothetical protein HRI_001970900 [Hibiscus trionum]